MAELVINTLTVSKGKHLTDHPLFANYYAVNSTATFDAVLRNSTLFGEDLEEWMAEKQGLFVDSAINTFGMHPNDRSPGSIHLVNDKGLLEYHKTQVS